MSAKTHVCIGELRGTSGRAVLFAALMLPPVAQTTTANTAPKVSLTAPLNGATFPAPVTITLNASASDADGSVTNVK